MSTPESTPPQPSSPPSTPASPPPPYAQNPYAQNPYAQNPSTQNPSGGNPSAGNPYAPNPAYLQPGQQYTGYYAAPGPARDEAVPTNRPATIAFVLAVLTVLGETAGGLFSRFIGMSGAYIDYETYFAVNRWVMFALALATLVMGAIGARKPRGRGFAGIAIGVGGFLVLNHLVFGLADLTAMSGF